MKQDKPRKILSVDTTEGFMQRLRRCCVQSDIKIGVWVIKVLDEAMKKEGF